MKMSFLHIIENSVKNNWQHASLTDYRGHSYTYQQVATQIEKLHICFKAMGIEKGDKIVICGRNSSNWGISFFSILTYGAVAVPLLNEFKSSSIHTLVNHSEAKALMVGDLVWEGLDIKQMEAIETVVSQANFSLLHSNEASVKETFEQIETLFNQKYPAGLSANDIAYHQDKPEELALINYTSGTTSAPKGVMLPYRSLWSNLKFAVDTLGECKGEKLVSMLPLAHMYGLAFEFIYQFGGGGHVYFLTRIPSPKVILEAFAEVKPNLIITVPLVLEKVIKNRVFPTLRKPLMRMLLAIPGVNNLIYAKVRKSVMGAFGNNFKELVVGGASFNPEIENFLRKIRFPYTVGYGMTECGPLLSYDGWKTTKAQSCGKAIPRMEMKINSPNPHKMVGEILFKGANLMLGYYKNPEATAIAIDQKGWLHTGDLGIIDPEGYIFIKGRSKNMLLSANGQNIYPEEIENRLNNLPYVSESLVVQRNDKLMGLIYPDHEGLMRDGVDIDSFNLLMETHRKEVNTHLPNYSQIISMEIREEEFEKTPKRSIKRFMYN